MEYFFEVDFSKSGNFDHHLSDLTDRCLYPLIFANGIANSDGIEADVSSYIGTGNKLTVTLDNRDGELSQDNPDALYYKLFKQGLLARVRVEADITYSFSYHLMDFRETLGEYGEQRVELVALEPLDRAIDISFSPKFYEGITTDIALSKGFRDKPNLIIPYTSDFFFIDVSTIDSTALIFDADTSPDVYLDFETGKSTLDFVGDVIEPEQNETRLFNYFQDIVQAEAMGRLFYDSRQVKFVFHNRYHDVNQAIQDTFTETEIHQVAVARDAVYNEVTLHYEPRAIGNAGVVIYSSDSVPITIPANTGDGRNVKKIRARYRDPDNPDARVSAKDVIQPVKETDILVYANPEGTGDSFAPNVTVQTDISATSCEIMLTNNADVPVYVTQLLIRGTPITKYNRETVSELDAQSIFDYNLSSLPPITFKVLDNPVTIQELATILSMRYREPVQRITQVTFMLYDGNDNFNNRVMRLSVGDAINLAESWSGHSKRYAITGESHTVNNDSHIVTFAVRPRDYQNFFVIDTSTIDGSDIIAF